MFETNLFLGLPISEGYEQALQQLPSSVKSTFIQSGSEYLQVIENAGFSYLGKFLGNKIDFASFELAHGHIMSILRRLIPSYSYSANSLVLVALVLSENSN